MKSLSLSRPLVIMVIGLPGAGKSFFARQFADMFGAPLVSVDQVRHSISPDSAYNAVEDKAVFAVTQAQLTELLKTQKTVVVDGGMNARNARAEAEKLASAHDYGTLCIWVQTDEPTSQLRSLKRNQANENDEFNSPMDEEAFTRTSKLFTAPRPSENVVVISGKHTFASQARTVLKKLVTPRDVPQAAPRGETEKPSHDLQPRRRSVTIN